MGAGVIVRLFQLFALRPYYFLSDCMITSDNAKCPEKRIAMARRHLCPWWVGFLHLRPVRKLIHDPMKIVVPFLETGMNVLEIGPGKGWFSLPIAETIGPTGMLYAVDIQHRMLRGLRRRADNAGVGSRIECRLSDETSLPVDDLEECISFTFAFAAVHEIPYKERLFEQIHSAMIPAGTMLMMDPQSRCADDDFRKTSAIAERCGFIARPGPSLKRFHSALLVRMC